VLFAHETPGTHCVIDSVSYFQKSEIAFPSKNKEAARISGQPLFILAKCRH